MKKVVNVLNVFLMCIGAVVGVGFLSGAEVWAYFVRFGENIWFLMALFFVLLFLFCNKIIKSSDIENELKMSNLLKIRPKSTTLVKLKIKQFLYVFEISFGAAAMFSGLKDIVGQLFFKNQILIYLLAVGGVFVLLLFGVKTISKFNNFVLAGLLIVVAVLVGETQTVNFNFSVVQNFNFSSAAIGGILVTSYVLMNAVHLAPIFKINKLQFSARGRVTFSALFSAVFCLLTLIIAQFMLKYSFLSAESLPLLAFFRAKGRLLSVFFVAILTGGLLSTLLVSLAGLKQEFSSRIKSRFLQCFCAVFVPLVLGFLPFKIFINFVYPLIGLANLITFMIL